MLLFCTNINTCVIIIYEFIDCYKHFLTLFVFFFVMKFFFFFFDVYFKLVFISFFRFQTFLRFHDCRVCYEIHTTINELSKSCISSIRWIWRACEFWKFLILFTINKIEFRLDIFDMSILIRNSDRKFRQKKRSYWKEKCS